MVTRAWRVYGAKGYRQRESFSKSYRWDFSDDMVDMMIYIQHSLMQWILCWRKRKNLMKKIIEMVIGKGDRNVCWRFSL